MSTFLRGLAKALIVLVIILSLLFGIAMAFIYSPFFRFPTGGEYPPPHIRQLVWPTIAYPAMTVHGGTIEVEVDLREDDDTGPQPQEVAGWRAVISPAREELAGLSYALEPLASRVDASGRWPSGSREGRSDSVWQVEFKVPLQVPPELYGLRVEAAVSGKVISDSQPHAVAVSGDAQDDFTFITLSDIHVHERGNSSPALKQTDKGISEDGEPVFLDRAIEQVNLVRPDFVLMLGDYIRGQRRPGELATEYAKFYRRLLDLEVPAFIIPGNHDQYVNEIDGARFFEENLGPLYYSFDLAGCHFTCLNTYQWPYDDRIIMNKLLYQDPNKWLGQVLEAEDERDPSTYGGELAWIEEDLAAHDQAPLRVMAMHHDPYTVDGQGASYGPATFWGITLPGGGGKGKVALTELARRHGVDMVFGGHLHRDKVGAVPWENGQGQTVYSCQSCVYFDEGGMSRRYPGYRIVEVEEAAITGFSYLDGVSSYPLYDGSVPGEKIDIDRLERPALSEEVTEGSGDGEWRWSVVVRNYLATGMELSGLVAPAPLRPEGGYRVEGGEIYNTVPMPGRPGWTLLYIEATVQAGVPGEAADHPGQPSVTTITIR